MKNKIFKHSEVHHLFKRTDIAMTWGYYYGPVENNGCQAVVLYGDNTSMLQKKKVIDLNYNDAGIVRAAFTYGDIDGDNVDDLILGGQLSTDIAGGNLNTRFIGIYTYNGSTDNFIQTTAKNFDLFEKHDNGEYVYEPMKDRGDKYYSSPAGIANIASVNMDGAGNASCIYLDSILYMFGDEGLSIKRPLDQDPLFNKNINKSGVNPYYIEYGIVSAGFTGDSKETLQLMQYYIPGKINVEVKTTFGGLNGLHHMMLIIMEIWTCYPFIAAVTVYRLNEPMMWAFPSPSVS